MFVIRSQCNIFIPPQELMKIPWLPFAPPIRVLHSGSLVLFIPNQCPFFLLQHKFRNTNLWSRTGYPKPNVVPRISRFFNREFYPLLVCQFNFFPKNHCYLYSQFFRFQMLPFLFFKIPVCVAHQLLTHKSDPYIPQGRVRNCGPNVPSKFLFSPVLGNFRHRPFFYSDLIRTLGVRPNVLDKHV